MNDFDKIIGILKGDFGFYPVKVKRTNNKGEEEEFIREWRYTNAIMLYAPNGTGKTRLSYEFAHKDRVDDQHHTLYYNAFTEDLFTWCNDLENDQERYLVINAASTMIQNLAGFPYDTEINKIFSTLCDLEAHFETHHHENGKLIEHPGDDTPREVRFSRTIKYARRDENGNQVVDAAGNKVFDSYEESGFKISRGEERLFVWSVFRYILDLAVKGDIPGLKYIYIDDPMSSLDDNNIILFASQLYDLINDCYNEAFEKYKVTGEATDTDKPKFIISTHHTVFFNTMINGLNGKRAYTLARVRGKSDRYFLKLNLLKDHTPMFYHLSALAQIKKELDFYDENGYCYLQKHHFNIIRGIVEQFAQLLGQKKSKKNEGFGHVLDGITYHFNNTPYTYNDKKGADNDDFNKIHAKVLYIMLNYMSHSGNAMFENAMLIDENIQYLRDLYEHLVHKYGIEVPEI